MEKAESDQDRHDNRPGHRGGPARAPGRGWVAAGARGPHVSGESARACSYYATKQVQQ